VQIAHSESLTHKSLKTWLREQAPAELCLDSKYGGGHNPEGDDKRLVEHGNYVASLARKNSRSAFILTGFKRKLG
jgi:hypothetical protein